MWRLKPFMPKEQNGLEGRTIDINNFRVQVLNAIAEGGFSFVYLARDLLNSSKQYALKHIICNNRESLALVEKEIDVLKSLKGHQNIVTLHANAVFDMGRTKEAILVMEYCEKSLVSVLESRGAAYFEEKKILAIFRDVCNAVLAMHCQSPPIAHRDLKAENILLGPDGLWKLCDFGSTSTNHKCFDKPEEMGVEEDIIRKHTTPAYRAPEMWDLYRKDTISEKVDIWALGCLLFRICYFKPAFDGESKLQVLNGNYRIPDLPKYSRHITDLMRDMLQPSPEARPDIKQVCFHVNGLLSGGLQKSFPDRAPELQQHCANTFDGLSNPGSKSSPSHRRSPPPSPATVSANQVSPASQNSRTSVVSGPAIGSFWDTQHAHDLATSEERSSASRMEGPPHQPVQKIAGKLADFFQEGTMSGPKAPDIGCKPDYQNDLFNAFSAESRTNNLSLESNVSNVALLEAEVQKLKEQLAQANIQKAEATSKYEKLSTICRSQQQEIQVLKQAMAARTSSPSKDPVRAQPSPSSQSSSNPPRGKIEGTVWELEQGLFDQGTPNPDPKLWQAFPGRQSAEVNPQAASWGFESESFMAVPARSSHINVSGSNLGRENRDNMPASQPAGWAGF